MFAAHLAHTAGAPVAGLFTPLGIALLGIFGLFGTFGAIVLVLLVASLVGGRSRSHGDPSGLGIVVGFAVLIALTVAINAAIG